MEQIPEKFLNDKGELNTSALVKSYCELEKKMSNMVSVPTADSDESVKQKFIDKKFEQVDTNLNFVLSLVQERIYKAFLEDAISLKDKFQNQINIFNSLAIIYCVLLGLFVMLYVLNKVKKMTNIVEVSTMRLNKAFCFIKENNLGNQINNSQSGSFIV